MANSGKVWTSESCEAAIEALDGMETELRQLEGLILALRLIGEAPDHVEPLAISAIAHCASAALGNLDQSWRTAIGTLREG